MSDNYRADNLQNANQNMKLNVCGNPVNNNQLLTKHSDKNSVKYFMMKTFVTVKLDSITMPES